MCAHRVLTPIQQALESQNHPVHTNGPDGIGLSGRDYLFELDMFSSRGHRRKHRISACPFEKAIVQCTEVLE